MLAGDLNRSVVVGSPLLCSFVSVSSLFIRPLTNVSVARDAIVDVPWPPLLGLPTFSSDGVFKIDLTGGVISNLGFAMVSSSFSPFFVRTSLPHKILRLPARVWTC